MSVKKALQGAKFLCVQGTKGLFIVFWHKRYNINKDMNRLIKKAGIKILRLIKHKKQKSSGFDSLGISPELLGILNKNKFKKPTPIQKKAIPEALAGKDVVGIAQTGTGKTIAFAIPVLQRLSADRRSCALILLPTRELAQQVADVCALFAPAAKIKTACLIGGESRDRQIRALRSNPRIVIGTPGRINDHIQHGSLHTNEVRILILDEADRMFDMGFAPQINRIIRTLPAKRQTMLFSATIPDEVMELAGRNMTDPFRVEASRSGSTAVKVHQQMYVMRTSLKPLLTLKLLEEHTGQVLIFVETRYDASKVASIIHHAKFSVAELHSDRSMGQRKEAMEGFKSGKYRILVATDIAARGIDVTGIEMVINYDIPAENDAYVHRIGRTGRAGKDGLAITFVRPDQGSDVKSIEELTGVKLEMMKHPAIPEEKLWGYEHAAANRGWNQSAMRRRR